MLAIVKGTVTVGTVAAFLCRPRRWRGAVALGTGGRGSQGEVERKRDDQLVALTSAPVLPIHRSPEHDGDGSPLQVDRSGASTSMHADFPRVHRAPTHSQIRRAALFVQGATVGAIILFGVMFALNLAANEASKESHVIGHTMTAPDGKPVAVETVESFATIWDMPSLDTNVLAELKGITLMVDMKEDAKVDAVVEMSIKVSGVWKPTGRCGLTSVPVSSSRCRRRLLQRCGSWCGIIACCVPQARRTPSSSSKRPRPTLWKLMRPPRRLRSRWRTAKSSRSRPVPEN